MCCIPGGGLCLSHPITTLVHVYSAYDQWTRYDKEEGRKICCVGVITVRLLHTEKLPSHIPLRPTDDWERMAHVLGRQRGDETDHPAWPLVVIVFEWHSKIQPTLPPHPETAIRIQCL